MQKCSLTMPCENQKGKSVFPDPSGIGNNAVGNSHAARTTPQWAFEDGNSGHLHSEVFTLLGFSWRCKLKLLTKPEEVTAIVSQTHGVFASASFLLRLWLHNLHPLDRFWSCYCFWAYSLSLFLCMVFRLVKSHKLTFKSTNFFYPLN